MLKWDAEHDLRASAAGILEGLRRQLAADEAAGLARDTENLTQAQGECDQADEAIQMRLQEEQGGLTQLRATMTKEQNAMAQTMTNGRADRQKSWAQQFKSMEHLIEEDKQWRGEHWIGGYSVSDLMSIKEGFDRGAVQGVLNAVNGLQDAVIGIWLSQSRRAVAFSGPG